MHDVKNQNFFVRFWFFINFSTGIYNFYGENIKIYEPQRPQCRYCGTQRRTQKIDIKISPLCPLRLCGSIVLDVLRGCQCFIII